MARNRGEGFQDGVNSAVTTALGQDHAKYIGDMTARVNPVMNLMNPSANPLLPPKFKSSDVKTAETNLRNALRTVDADPQNPSMTLRSSDVSNIRLNSASGGTGGFKTIGVCEAIQTMDCNAFDKPNFQANCGICHEGGVDSGNNRKTGGLYITEEDKFNAEADMRRMQSRRAKYSPSVGKCAPDRFTITKEQCIRMKHQMECEKKQDFSSPGCAQCYQDETFKYITSELDTTDPTLVVAGSGSLTLTIVGKPQPKQFATPITLTEGAKRIELPDFAEGDSLQLAVSPGSASIAGYLTGKTPTGEFRLDITRLIQTDTITGAKPRMAGQQDIAGDMYMTIRPGRGKESMNLVFQNVFTFVDTTEEESFQCASAPFIKKASSAAFLNSGPCYKKGSGPGKYSMECLQTVFTSAGCDVKGEGYPNTQAKATALMTRGGQALKIGQIAGQVYQDSLSSYSGRSASGAKLSLDQWNTVSRTCTGKQILSPCDLDDKANGPLSSECLSYLWQNMGATDKRPGSTGPTYSNTEATASLAGTKNQFCTPKGTMAPINASGQLNQQAFQTAQKQGGVQKVKAFYDTIHKRANDNRLKDSERQQAIQQCYGVDLQPLASNRSSNLPINVKDGLPSTLTNASGRTKTTFKQENYPAMDWSKWTRAVNVLGPYRMAPWNGTWNGLASFPDDGTAKWIWTNANAARDEPTMTEKPFVKRYVNSTHQTISAVIYACVDNVGSMWLNDAPVALRWEGFGRWSIQLPPGESKLQINARNTGGPAGLIVICKEGTKTLFRSDASWVTRNDI